MDEDLMLKNLAKDIAVHCFRNTHLENLHAKLDGFTDSEMKVLMIEAVNNVYTYLYGLRWGFTKEMENYIAMYRGSIKDWNEPELIKEWLKNNGQDK